MEISGSRDEVITWGIGVREPGVDVTNRGQIFEAGRERGERGWKWSKAKAGARGRAGI